MPQENSDAHGDRRSPEAQSLESDEIQSKRPKHEQSATEIPSRTERDVPTAGSPAQTPPVLLPSQPPALYTTMELPPSALLSQDMPASDPANLVLPLSSSTSRTVDPQFAARANEMINAMLGRTPVGGSVVDPDSVLDESGRLYHGYKDGRYFLPNDAAEQDRLDFQHAMFNILLNGWLHLAPLTTVPKYVLDVATGTGIWALDFAEKYSASFVVGTDLSAIQPNPKVPNCVFEKDDAEAPWLFPVPSEHRVGTESTPSNIKFDYVHLRLTCSCFDDARAVMAQAYENMAPGGWIEYQDAFWDTSSDGIQGTAGARWYDGLAKGAATKGRDLTMPKDYKKWLEEAGFVDVQERRLIWPWNPWPKDRQLKRVGLYQLRILLDNLKGMSWKMLSLAGYTSEESETIIAEALHWFSDTKNKPFAWFYVTYGRKPFDGERQDYPPPSS